MIVDQEHYYASSKNRKKAKIPKKTSDTVKAARLSAVILLTAAVVQGGSNISGALIGKDEPEPTSQGADTPSPSADSAPTVPDVAPPRTTSAPPASPQSPVENPPSVTDSQAADPVVTRITCPSPHATVASKIDFCVQLSGADLADETSTLILVLHFEKKTYYYEREITPADNGVPIDVQLTQGLPPGKSVSWGLLIYRVDSQKHSRISSEKEARMRDGSSWANSGTSPSLLPDKPVSSVTVTQKG